MTEAIKKNLEALDKSIRDNTPVVRAKLAESGIAPDSSVVFSTAKYFATIERLAKE
jgi:hypothetical protein